MFVDKNTMLLFCLAIYSALLVKTDDNLQVKDNEINGYAFK